jgi:hypothetical protein
VGVGEELWYGGKLVGGIISRIICYVKVRSKGVPRALTALSGNAKLLTKLGYRRGITGNI